MQNMIYKDINEAELYYVVDAETGQWYPFAHYDEGMLTMNCDMFATLDPMIGDQVERIA